MNRAPWGLFLAILLGGITRGLEGAVEGGQQSYDKQQSDLSVTMS